MPKTEVRDQLYEAYARIGQAAGSPRRLRLLNILAQAEKTVEALAEETGQSTAAVSAHLKVLREAHLVAGRREGRHVRYRVADDTVTRFWVALQALGEARLPQVRDTVHRYFSEPETLEPFDAWTLLGQVQRGEVLLLDLRKADEYAAGHIPGARSVPAIELESRLAELPTDRRIVAYCRGPYCVVALETVERLRAKGLEVRRLPAGIAEWQAGGHDLERIPNPLT